MLDPPWPRTISEMKLFVIRGVPKAYITDFFHVQLRQFSVSFGNLWVFQGS
jgi:hypothetical protein